MTTLTTLPVRDGLHFHQHQHQQQHQQNHLEHHQDLQHHTNQHRHNRHKERNGKAINNGSHHHQTNNNNNNNVQTPRKNVKLRTEKVKVMELFLLLSIQQT